MKVQSEGIGRRLQYLILYTTPLLQGYQRENGIVAQTGFVERAGLSLSSWNGGFKKLVLGPGPV
eukprot:4023576-Pleurochrysis_carterae.AAC.1